MLTNTQIKTAKPKEKPYKIFDKCLKQIKIQFSVL